MLSLKGARQMSGNNVRISIFMTGKRRTPNVQRCNAFSGSAIRVETDAYKLFHNLEDRPLAMARGRTGEQCANSVNGLASAANNPANVSSSKLQLKDRGSAAWNFCKNHVVRKFNQLADDKLEELFHEPECMRTFEFVTQVDRALRRSMRAASPWKFTD